MSEQNCAEAATKAMYPLFESADVDASIAFYQKLGYTEDSSMKSPDGKTVHTCMTTPCGRTSFMVTFNPEYKAVQGGMSLYCYAPEGLTADRAFEKISGAGAKIVQGLTDQMWGDRNFTFEDPDGYRWTFAQAGGKTSYPEGTELKQAALA